MRAHHGVTAGDTNTHRKPLSCETGGPIAELLFDSLLLRKLRRQSFFAPNKN